MGKGLTIMITDTTIIVAMVLTLTVKSTRTYKPVILMHGILESNTQFDKMVTYIEEKHPGTYTLAITDFSYLWSLEPMWHQVNAITVKVRKVMDQNPEGVHFICYSQGGLICMGLLQTMRHNVDTFIALSSPLAGQFGDTEYLKYFFPKFLKDSIYKLFYTETGQDVSIANYWNDPHHQNLYSKESKYLAVINNQSIPSNPRSHDHKRNFLRLKRLILIGGPDDGVIGPWQSSHFRFYDENERVLELNDTEWYRRDSFGLQTMFKQGAVHIHTVAGVEHLHWITNYTVFENYILPYIN